MTGRSFDARLVDDPGRELVLLIDGRPVIIDEYTFTGAAVVVDASS